MNDQSITRDMVQQDQINLKARYAQSQASIKQKELKREAAGYAVGALLGWFGEMTSGKGPLSCAVCLSKAARAFCNRSPNLFFITDVVIICEMKTQREGGHRHPLYV